MNHVTNELTNLPSLYSLMLLGSVSSEEGVFCGLESFNCRVSVMQLLQSRIFPS
jgi:hypothetical protein